MLKCARVGGIAVRGRVSIVPTVDVGAHHFVAALIGALSRAARLVVAAIGQNS